MSALIPSGNATGTGTMTLLAPPTNGTQTITLPDTTGTVATLNTPSFLTTIGVGGTTASASGAGISFPATQSASSDANTLDDYEEGTFTPTLTSGAGTITTITTGGWYVKTGRSVTIFAYWNVANVGSASSTFFVGGLPFTIVNTGSFGAGNRGFISIVREDALTGYLGQAFWTGNGTSGQVQKYDGNNYTWSNGMVLVTSGTYETAS